MITRIVVQTMATDLSNYKELYVKTAHEFLEAMQASIMLITADVENTEAIETLYRAAHSLKSQSMLMGYKNTASLNEFIEHTLRNVLEGKNSFTEKIFFEIKTALQKIEESLTSIEKLNKELTLTNQITN